MTALKSAESISSSTLLWNVKVVFIFLEPKKGWSFLKQKAGTSFLLREKKYLLREKLGGVGTSWSSSHGTNGYNSDKFGWWHQSPLAKGLECQRAGTGYTTTTEKHQEGVCLQGMWCLSLIQGRQVDLWEAMDSSESQAWQEVSFKKQFLRTMKNKTPFNLSENGGF